jgi:hypothetical protein
MKKNFENIRSNNEKLYGALQDSKRKEHEVNSLFSKLMINVKVYDLIFFNALV